MGEKRNKQTKNVKHQKTFQIKRESRKFKDRIIRVIWKLFETDEEKEERKAPEKKTKLKFN